MKSSAEIAIIMEYENRQIFEKIYNHIEWLCVVIVGLRPHFTLDIEKEPYDYILQFKSPLKDNIFSLSIHDLGRGNKLPWKNIVEVYY